MKNIFAVFLLFSLNSFAQKQAIFRIDSLPKQGILLDKGWKWHAGDNPDFARADFDDSAWESIDPTKEISELSQIFDEQAKWLRIYFDIKSALPKPMGIAVNQAGASEVYLNGKLVHRFGNFDTNPDKVIAYDPLDVPIYLPIDSMGSYTLAVRYRLQPNIRYTNIFGLTKNRLFKAMLVDLVPTLHKQRAFNAYFKGLDIFVAAALFMLFILHLAFYIYQRDSKTLLILAIYFLLTATIRVFKIIGQSQNLVEDRYFTLNFSNFLTGVVFILIGAVTYRLAKIRFDKYYYFLIIFQIFYVVVSVTNYGKPYQSILLLTGSVYCFIVMIKLVNVGIKKSIKGFWIFGVFLCINAIGIVLIASVILFFNYGISPFGHNDLTIPLSPYLVDFIVTFSYIAVPIGLSLLIGIENRETNRELSNQLILNEELKNNSVKHEQEKQQILENQNEILEIQVAERTAELNQSLEILKSTQAQLIQKEKLASLGELTAGIAHEIQNPLNFVNNFSELSVELIEELKSPLTPRGGGEESELLEDISQNLEKINHHGKRASSIVKGMLEHSRASTGVKELTDINALADEYLRLSYHGLRAKDSTFNSDFKTDFDENLPKIEVIPQDFGRVLLNLINNAFYAVNVARISNSCVIIKTETIDNQIIIKIKDNGIGMNETTKAKIFQPFFTTKPTGQGTGLGLSLAYDIITKGHGGTIDVETKEGEGTTFIIKLPI